MNAGVNRITRIGLGIAALLAMWELRAMHADVRAQRLAIGELTEENERMLREIAVLTAQARELRGVEETVGPL